MKEDPSRRGSLWRGAPSASVALAKEAYPAHILKLRYNKKASPVSKEGLW
jgi:hypothetical protein